MPTSDNIVEDTPTWIPEGYVVVKGPDDQRYLIRQFMEPALHQTLDANVKKSEMSLDKAEGSDCKKTTENFSVIGEGKIMVPLIPGSSDTERLSAHAEVLALMERLGISYKDAAHRLYMAELERLKADENSYKYFCALHTKTKTALRNAFKAVKGENSEEMEE